MCYFNIKPFINDGSNDTNLVLLPYRRFKKLSNVKILDVISGSKGGISKSYESKIRKLLRDIKLYDKDGKPTFKLVVPYTFKDLNLRLEPALLYRTASNELIYMDLNSKYYTHCETCVVREDCVNALKLIAKENGIKVTHLSPNRAWAELIEKLVKKIEDKNVIFKSELFNFRHKLTN
ncbi:MAG: hypothetical protein OWQ54_08735 [Sulfolobaceae archaeon]|nr:hypothetical protein [Sulfolobaceae archaeon]